MQVVDQTVVLVQDAFGTYFFYFVYFVQQSHLPHTIRARKTCADSSRAHTHVKANLRASQALILILLRRSCPDAARSASYFCNVCARLSVALMTAGNYVVQYVLEQVPQYRHNIINIIAQSIIQLSRQKFSSNVVEKCLQLVCCCLPAAPAARAPAPVDTRVCLSAVKRACSRLPPPLPAPPVLFLLIFLLLANRRRRRGRRSW